VSIQRGKVASLAALERYIGPFVEHGALEPQRLAVGLGTVGTGGDVSGSDLQKRLSEGSGEHVALGLVGHDLLDPHPEIRKVVGGPQYEPGAGLASFVGMDLDKRVSGVIVDRDVQVVITGAASLGGPGLAALPELLPSSTGSDTPELLHDDVQELTCAAALAAEGLGVLIASPLAATSLWSTRRRRWGRMTTGSALGPIRATPS
jgi:hypothetical protein